jgi:hypothetical protein
MTVTIQDTPSTACPELFPVIYRYLRGGFIVNRIGLWFALLGIAVVGIGCASSTTSDTELPTLAQLPTTDVSPVFSTPLSPSFEDSKSTSTPTPGAVLTEEDGIYGVNQFDPPPTLLPNVTVTAEVGLVDALAVPAASDAFPVTLEVGAEVVLRGQLTVDDSGQRGVLTNSRAERVTVLLDEFTAMVAGGQSVIIIGEVVEDELREGAVIVRVTSLTILSDALFASTPIDGDLTPGSTPTAAFS